MMKKMRFMLITAMLVMTMPAIADEDRVQAIVEQLAEVLFESERQDIVSALVSQGLDESDGDLIFDQLTLMISSCAVDAIRTFSDQNDLDFTDQLDALEASIAQGATDDYLNSFDDDEMQSIVEPCINEAFQGAGLTFP